MDDAAGSELDPIARDIYDLMRRQPGEVATPDGIAAQMNDATSAVTAALRQLEQRGLIVRAATQNGPAYILSPAAPEL